MQALYISYPPGNYASQRFLVPPIRSPYYDDPLISGELWDGDPTKIGNRPCVHVKYDMTKVNRISNEYAITLREFVLNSTGLTPYPFCPYTISSFAQSSYLSAAFAPTERILYKQVVASSYKTDYYYQVLECQQGYVRSMSWVESFYFTGKPRAVSATEYEFRQVAEGNPYTTGRYRNYTYVDGAYVPGTTWYNVSVGAQEVSINVRDLPVLKGYWLLYGKGWMDRVSKISDFKTFGQLSNDCATKGGRAIATSSAQYLIELNQIASILSPFTTLMRGAWTAKKIASSWLSYNYGTQQTLKDTYAIISGIIRTSGLKVRDYDVLRSRDFLDQVLPNDVRVTGYRALTIYYRPISGWLLDTYRALRRWGLEPSLSLAWNLVPLSFVVDWLLPIGNMLEHVDSTGFTDSLEIIESVCTSKFSFEIPASILLGEGSSGYATITVYDRSILNGEMPKPEFRFDSLSFNGMQAINGISLVVQRR